MAKATIIKEKFYVFKTGAKYLALEEVDWCEKYYLSDNFLNLEVVRFSSKSSSKSNAQSFLNILMFQTDKSKIEEIRGLEFSIVEIKLTKAYIESDQKKS